MPASCSDAEFLTLWEQHGGARGVSQALGINERAVHRRRRRLEARDGMTLIGSKPSAYSWPAITEHIYYDHPYTVVIGSDAHVWPGSETPAYWVMLQVIEAIQPEVVILNGDIFDGARISRHGRIGWDQRPMVHEELKAVTEWLGLVEDAAGEADKYWTVGNHDIRFETHLAEHAGHFEQVKGTRLSDHFPAWNHCTSAVLNDECMVKHRWHSGIHGNYNNVLKGGKSIITGHTHRLDIREYTDYSGSRFGAECGTLADPNGGQFDYTEHTPLNWQPGFLVVEVDGDEVTPEKVRVLNGRAKWRGKTWRG